MILKIIDHFIIAMQDFSFLGVKLDETFFLKLYYTINKTLQLLKNNIFHIVKITCSYFCPVILIFLIRTFKQLINKKKHSSSFKLSNVFINKVYD